MITNNMVKKLLLVFLLIMALPTNANIISCTPNNNAEISKAAEDYFNNRMTKIVFYEKLKKCSNSGDIRCSAILGSFYYFDKKYSQAYPLLFKSKDTDCGSYNYYLLGLMIEQGNGVLQNSDKAISYLKKSLSLDKDYALTIALELSQMYVNKFFSLSLNDSSTENIKLVEETVENIYIWLKISAALGQKEWAWPNGKKIPIRVFIDESQKSLSIAEKRHADKLTSQICSTIPSCIQ